MSESIEDGATDEEKNFVVPTVGSPKPPEIIEAQMAAFAAEQIDDYGDKKHIFNNLEGISSEGLKDVTRTTESREYSHIDVAGNPIILPEGTEVTVASSKNYIDYLRSVGGSRNESIQGRADMIKAYKTFAPKIEELKAALGDSASREDNPAFLGRGSNSGVFIISEAGKSYAVRIPHGERLNPTDIDSHVAGAILGKGVPHLEQIVAASYKDGVTEAEIMLGAEVGTLDAETINQVTDDQLNELLDTLITANNRGIVIDPKPSNFFYDPKSGYGIVDYFSLKASSKLDRNLGSLARTIGWMATVIDNTGFYGKATKPYGEKNADDYTKDLELRLANIHVLKRYRDIVEGRLAGPDQPSLLRALDEKIQGDQEIINNYYDPQWVADRIAEDRERAAKPKPSLDSWMNP